MREVYCAAAVTRALDATLRDFLGDIGGDAIWEYVGRSVKREELHEKPREFFWALSSVMGDAARIVGRIVLKRIAKDVAPEDWEAVRLCPFVKYLTDEFGSPMPSVDERILRIMRMKEF